MSIRVHGIGLFLLILSGLLLMACPGSPRGDESKGSEPVAESPGQLTLGSALSGEAAGFWPQDSSSFGAAFTRIGYLGQTPRALGDGAWLNKAQLSAVVRNELTRTTELSVRELAAGDQAFVTVGSLAHAYHSASGALALLGKDAKLSYRVMNAESSYTQFSAPEALLPGPYSLALSSRYALVQDPAGAISVFSLPDLRLRWQTQGVWGTMALTEESVFYVSPHGSFTMRALEDGAIALDLAMGLKTSLVPPVYDGSFIYIADGDGSVLALDPQSSSLLWRLATGYPVEQLISDRGMVYAFGLHEALGIAKDQGRIIARVALPERALLPPQLFGGTMVYVGVDGYVYANDLGLAPELGVLSVASAEEERLARAIRFRLDKYLVDHDIAELAGAFLPYVDLAPHDGVLPFTVFEYRAPEQSGEMAVELLEADGKTKPVDGIVSVFDEHGDEIKANVDEFGSHPSFTHWFDAGRRYYLAVGRRAPGQPPLFLRIRKL